MFLESEWSSLILWRPSSWEFFSFNLSNILNCFFTYVLFNQVSFSILNCTTPIKWSNIVLTSPINLIVQFSPNFDISIKLYSSFIKGSSIVGYFRCIVHGKISVVCIFIIRPGSFENIVIPCCREIYGKSCVLFWEFK